MRFLITLFFFSVAFLALGQNYQEGNGSKISDAEKKRLETEFRALGSFYINDSGLVVYQTGNREEKKSTENKNEQLADPQSSTTVNIDTVQNDTLIVYQSIEDQRKENIVQEKENGQTNTPIIIKRTAPPNSSFFKKEIVEKETKSTPSENTKIDIEIVPKTEEKVVVIKNEDAKPLTKEKSPTKNTQKNGSILNQRRESQYKTMEEAALAVEALLEELKKEEGQTTSSSSMSSKLSRGVNKSLRKKPDAFSTNNDIYTSQKSSKVSNYEEDNSSNFGVEPSYFINGKQVEKVEVLKLNKKDIIRREVRVRNTITGNPNGEVWYDVK